MSFTESINKRLADIFDIGRETPDETDKAEYDYLVENPLVDDDWEEYFQTLLNYNYATQDWQVRADFEALYSALGVSHDDLYQFDADEYMLPARINRDQYPLTKGEIALVYFSLANAWGLDAVFQQKDKKKYEHLPHYGELMLHIYE